MLTGIRLISAIGYKYNARKVLSFIVAMDTGITKAGIPYLSKYPEPFYNFSISPFPRPIFIYKFFGYVNMVEYHNKSRQYDLALKNFWVTLCGLLRL